MCAKKCPDNHDVTGCHGCGEQFKNWALTNFYVCCNCGYIDEIVLPETDTCPACRTVGLRRQVLEGNNELVDFDPTRHI